MFIIRYVKYAFDFPNILARRKESFIKILLFFILMVLISNVPHIYSIISNEGWSISFIESTMETDPPAYGSFDLPDDISIHYYGLDVPDSTEHFVEYKDYTFVFNAQEEDYSDIGGQKILLLVDKIIYINADGDRLEGTYRGFNTTYDFDSVMLDAAGWQSNIVLLASNIEAGFSSYVIFYSVITYTMVQLMTMSVLVLIIGGLLMLFKFGHSHFMSYPEALKIVVLTTPVPVFIGFVVGFIADPLTPFIVQFGMGVITMYVMVKFSKFYFNG